MSIASSYSNLEKKRGKRENIESHVTIGRKEALERDSYRGKGDAMQSKRSVSRKSSGVRERERERRKEEKVTCLL